jgi:hypothetical protein
MTVNGHFLGVLVFALAGVPGIAAPMAAPADQLGSGSPPAATGSPAPATPAAPEQSQPATASDVPAEQVDRVRRALQNKPLVDLNSEQLRFYIQIIGRQPMTFADYAKGSDLMHAPTRRGNPMSHQEFLNLVTPREIHSSGGITPSELLQFALTNWLGQTLVRRGLEEIKEARTEKEKQEIRDRIDRELLILRANEDN